MAGGGGNADGDVGFQIAPMIDLILVLMVFFMSTVALKQVENELGITLPGNAGDTKQTQSVDVKLDIGIDLDGSVNVNGATVADGRDKQLEPLRAKLQEQVELFGEKTPVVITPQPDVAHGRVIDVLNACSASKIKNVSFGAF